LESFKSCWQDLALLVQLYSVQNLLINSHQAHQIAAHPFHHLPMGLQDDNSSSFGDHYGSGGHAGLDGLASCCGKICCASSVSAKIQCIENTTSRRYNARYYDTAASGITIPTSLYLISGVITVRGGIGTHIISGMTIQ
jgi:hypothetical protein